MISFFNFLCYSKLRYNAPQFPITRNFKAATNVTPLLQINKKFTDNISDSIKTFLIIFARPLNLGKQN